MTRPGSVKLDNSARFCEDVAGGEGYLCIGDENSEHGSVDIEREE